MMRVLVILVLVFGCGCSFQASTRGLSARTSSRCFGVAEWRALGVGEGVAERLVALDLESPNGIQKASFEVLAGGGDCCVHAETGSGKTLAYALPLCARGARTLVIAPGAGLTKQIRRVLDDVLGEALASTFVVATPKELLKGRVDASRGGFDAAVLDEADALLRPLGKYASAESKARKRERPATKCLRRLLETGDEIQVVAASATVGRPLRRELDGIIRGALPVFAEKRPSIPVARATEAKDGTRAVTAPLAMRHVVAPFWDKRSGGDAFVPSDEALEALKDALDALDPSRPLVVVSHGGDPQRARDFLRDDGRTADCLADVDARAIGDDRARGDVLVADAHGIRGLDIQGVDVVICVGRPSSSDEYLHVAGRTARNGKPGVCVTLAAFEDAKKVSSWASQLDVAFLTKDPVDLTPDLLPPPA